MRQTIIAGIIREQWDDATRTLSRLDETGTMLPGYPRPYTADETAAADQAATQAATEATLTQARADIITTALVWLTADATQASTRITQINAALADITTKLAQINAYSFNGATVAAINSQLNSALKPNLAALWQRLADVGTLLKELEETRDRHGQYLAWLAKYVTGRL